MKKRKIHPVTGALLVGGVTKRPRCTVLKGKHNSNTCNFPLCSRLIFFANICICGLGISPKKVLYRKNLGTSFGKKKLILKNRRTGLEKNWSCNTLLYAMDFLLLQLLKPSYLRLGPRPHFGTHSRVAPIAANPKIARERARCDQTGLE